MVIRSRRSAVEAIVLIGAIMGWVAFTQTTSFRVKTVLAEGMYPKSSGDRPDTGQRLRLLAGMSWPKSRDTSDMVAELAGLGEPAVPALAEAFQAGPEGHPNNVLAGEALVKIGSSSAVDALVAIIRQADNGTYSRLRAVDRLGHLGARAKAAVPALVEVMQEPGGFLRFAAIKALALIDPDLALERGLPIVRDMLANEANVTDRWWAQLALFYIGPRTEETRCMIERELAAGPYVRPFAEWAGTHGPGEYYGR